MHRTCHLNRKCNLCESYFLDKLDSAKLARSKVFCTAPWVSINVHPEGFVSPCSFFEQHSPLGTLKSHSLQEIRRCASMQELQSNMLKEKESAGCRQCYAQEKAGSDSLRLHMNRIYSDSIPEIAACSSLEKTEALIDVRYLELQFSNLCNFRCRMCGPAFSSSWIQDHKKMFPGEDVKVHRLTDVNINAEKEIHQLLKGVHEIYMWGGEPLISEEHYRLLQALIDLKRTDVRIRYSTNFSNLEFKGHDVIEYWKKFPNLSIGASLDAVGSRGELIRKGMDWQEIVANRERLKREIPRIDFFVSCTVSVMNVWHITDFHREWVEKDYIKMNQFNPNILLGPEYYRIQILSPEMKLKVKEKIQNHLTSFIGDAEEFRGLRERFQAVINFMESENRETLVPEFKLRTSQLDEIRGENFKNTFPELASLF